MTTRYPEPSKLDRQSEKPFTAGLDLVFDAIDLIHKVGTSRSVSATVTSKEHVGDPEYSVHPGTPIEVQASFESVDEGIFVTGSASSTVNGECARCLDPVSDDLVARFDELFTYPEKVPADIEEEIPTLTSDAIDLAPLVHDAFAVAAPYQVLCREDCPGLCDQCGFRLEEDPSHEHSVIDPRFAALAELLDESPEGSER